MTLENAATAEARNVRLGGGGWVLRETGAGDRVANGGLYDTFTTFNQTLFLGDRGRWLIDAILLEQNDEWAVQRGRYMTLERVGALSDDPAVSLPILAG